MEGSYIDRVEEHRDKLPDDLTEAYDYALKIGCSPKIAVATVHYTAGVVNNVNLVQKEVADYYDTTASTIRRRHNEILNHGGELPHDVFLCRDFNEWNDIESKPSYKNDDRTVDQLVDELQEHAEFETSWSGQLSNKSVLQITGEDDILSSIDHLQEIGLDIEQDVSISVSPTKSGLVKLLKHYNS